MFVLRSNSNKYVVSVRGEEEKDKANDLDRSRRFHRTGSGRAPCACSSGGDVS